MKLILSYIVTYIIILSGFTAETLLMDNANHIGIRMFAFIWAILIIYIPISLFWFEQRKIALTKSILSKAIYNKGDIINFNKSENPVEVIVGKIVHIDLIQDNIVYTIDEIDKNILHLVPEKLIKPSNSNQNE